MAKRKPKSTDVEALQRQLAAYEEVFDEVQHFIDLIRKQEEQVASAQTVTYAAKEAYEKAKAELAAEREARDGTKHALFVYLKPGPAEILPLFDRMEPANAERHGKQSDQWRKEPISALRLSLIATNLLTAADIVFVGQLQDRMLADGQTWWEKIDGLSAPVAAAIADRLHDFMNERSR